VATNDFSSTDQISPSINCDYEAFKTDSALSAETKIEGETVVEVVEPQAANEEITVESTPCTEETSDVSAEKLNSSDIALSK
jgi:hypothetical protein